jgi:hypothetical protein
MTSCASVSCNFDSLPIELQNKIWEEFTLEELFELKQLNIPSFESIASYIDYYLETQKYKEHNRLKDCMYLINSAYYKNFIYEHLYDLVSNLGIQFVNDVTNAGGPVGYMILHREENPRNIYTIKIEMSTGQCIIYYEIKSTGVFASNNLIYYDSYYSDRRGRTRNIKFNVDTIVSTLIDIVKMMSLDSRKIKSIQYYKEKYEKNFLLNNTLPEVTFIYKN